MGNFVTLTCPTCGGKLQISNDIDRFACMYCGNEHIVKRGIGTISLQPVVEGLKEVQTGVDKTASELAIKRLKTEIEDLVKQRDHVKDQWTANFLWVSLWPLVVFIPMTVVCFFFGDVFK